MNRLAFLLTIVLCLPPFVPGPVQASDEGQIQVKELNFVFLHGAGGHTGTLQPLADSIIERSEGYVLDYERANPGIKIQVNALQRYYPNDVDIETWADNIAYSIDRHFRGKKDLILIGHSMGGKAALYAVAHDTRGLADRVALVVTVNSPIKKLGSYYITGGGSAAVFCAARWLLSDGGVCDSIDRYDSSQDGSWVAANKRWLAFISAEPAPVSPELNVGGLDGWPRDMDDGFVPISAQYSDGADVVYYGESGHGDFSNSADATQFMGEQILGYLFGGDIGSPVVARSGAFGHRAGWLPIRYSWEETFGEVLQSTGRLSHTNESYLKPQYWEDVVGDCPPGTVRGSYEVQPVNSLPLITGIQEARWLTADVPDDCRLYVRSKAAPKTRVQLDWNIFRHGRLPPGARRDHYEINVVAGTPQAGIPQVSWATDDVRDVRLRVRSRAEGPFRWFKAEWKVYSTESRQRKVIDQIRPQPLH